MGAWPKWKVFEKFVATELGWKRKVRADDYSISDTDIEPPPELDFLKLDCKKHKKFQIHSLMHEAETKYCTNPEDFAVVFTQEVLDLKGNPRHKAGQKLPTYATIRLELFKKLIDSYQKLEK